MSLNYNKNLVKNAKALRKNATPWENKLWYEFLRAYPMRFQRQKTIGNYIADFYCAKAGFVVELDGSQHFDESSQKYDKERTSHLRELNLVVLRFTNLDVDNNFYGVCTEIDAAVRRSRPQSPVVTAPSSEGAERH